MPRAIVSPFAGLLVADFSRVLAGPLCTMLLADAGARVIKIEEPRGDETRRWGPPFAGEESAYFLALNRNKESIALDLKTREGREVARRLVAKADVVVENFRSPQKKAFGLTPRAIRRINPRAVICSIVGFEQDGPDADLPGYDLLAQAAGGLMAITGPAAGEPSKVGVALSD
ncbi:MAG: CoA transferase, partial [Thermoanaerobaculia bacterium]